MTAGSAPARPRRPPAHRGAGDALRPVRLHRKAVERYRDVCGDDAVAQLRGVASSADPATWAFPRPFVKQHECPGVTRDAFASTRGRTQVVGA